MSSLAWNALLLAWKWVFILLVYSVIFVLLFYVRREMSRGSRRAGARPVLAAGRLQVLQCGSAVGLAPGMLIDLKTVTALGADTDNDVPLESPFISGHHARLSWDGAAWWVEDLDSRNGTLVGGKPCLSRTPLPLPPGVPLQVGDVTFQLVETE
ncbi:MAG TPA: FHA domain-containing protein [Anaerolineaceae bacterium]